MTVCAIVPVRSLADGKRRLAGVMEDAERAALNEEFLVHTLALAAALPRPDNRGESGLRRSLPTPPPPAPCMSPIPGAGSTRRSRPGAKRRGGAGRGGYVVLPSDLPTARPDDVLALAQAASPVAIAPDRGRQGTNGLSLDSGLDFAFRYGPGSFAAHVVEAERLGIAPEVIDNPRLALDIDTPRDWRDWRDWRRNA